MLMNVKEKANCGATTHTAKWKKFYQEAFSGRSEQLEYFSFLSLQRYNIFLPLEAAKDTILGSFLFHWCKIRIWATLID